MVVETKYEKTFPNNWLTVEEWIVSDSDVADVTISAYRTKDEDSASEDRYVLFTFDTNEAASLLGDYLKLNHVRYVQVRDNTTTIARGNENFELGIITFAMKDPKYIPLCNAALRIPIVVALTTLTGLPIPVAEDVINHKYARHWAIHLLKYHYAIFQKKVSLPLAEQLYSLATKVEKEAQVEAHDICYQLLTKLEDADLFPSELLDENIRKRAQKKLYHVCHGSREPKSMELLFWTSCGFGEETKIPELLPESQSIVQQKWKPKLQFGTCSYDTLIILSNLIFEGHFLKMLK